MIGNDIVDLALAKIQSNWKRDGYLDKIFTLQEQISIQNSVNQEIEIWKLWSRKEAAYKIWNRQTGIRKYNPIAFECLDFDNNLGKVVFKNQIYYTKTEINSEFIYTIAVSKKEDFDKIKIFENSIEIEKQNGIPFYRDELRIKRIVSKTNHGKFERIISI